MTLRAAAWMKVEEDVSLVTDTIECVTPPGVGVGLRFRVVVGDQRSALSPPNGGALSYAAPAMFVSQTNPRRRRGGRSRAGCDDGGEEGFGVNGFRRGLVPAAAPQSARSSYKRVNAQVCPVPSEGRPRYAETIIIIRK